MAVLGLDVSSWQGAIDWPQVRAAGKRFMLAKATEATTFYDPWFLRNWTEAKRAGLIPGAYHYARPSANSATAEADWFIGQMGGPTFAPGELVALDLEDDGVPAGVSVLDWTLEWLARVRAGCGVKPVLYSGAAYLAEHGCLYSAPLADYGLWLASWSGTPRPPVPPPDWPFAAFHQYSAHGQVPGIAGAVDLDVFYGTLKQLRRYGAP